MELEKKLGSISVLTPEQRLEYYQKHTCHPTPGEAGEGLERVKWLKRMFDAEPMSTFLDLGCNDGFTTRWMVDKPNFISLVGVDPGIEQIKWAKQHIIDRNNWKKAEYYCMGYQEYELETKRRPMWEAFDGVSCFEMIEHFTKEEALDLLKFIKRMLAPNGRAFVNTPNIDGRWGRTNPDPHHLVLYDVPLLESTIREAVGNVELHWDGYQPNCEFLSVMWRNNS